MTSIFTANLFNSNDNVVKTFYPSPLDHNAEYEVINLADIKSGSIHHMENYHWARSAVMYGNSIDAPLGETDLKVLAVSPPTAINLESFKFSNTTITNDVVVNEHVEGTMVNVFYDPRNKHWEMATKHAIGGNYWFYRTQYGESGAKNKTFRTMFVEALGGDVSNPDARIFLEDALQFLNDFPKEFSYSFVLQHPENHIILNIAVPRVYLVAVYEIGQTVQQLHPDVYESRSEQWACLANQPISFPARFKNGCGPEPYDEYESIVNLYMGVMFQNILTGERAVMRNPYYESLRELRGNHPNLKYHFFEMLQDGTLPQFMYTFPRYEQLFTEFNAEYIQFIRDIHQYYVQRFITKTHASMAVPKKYFVHVMRLHNDIFKTMRKKITLHEVNEYFMSMTPGQIMFYLDYDNKRCQNNMEEMFEDLERIAEDEEEEEDVLGKSFVYPQTAVAWGNEDNV